MQVHITLLVFCNICSRPLLEGEQQAAAYQGQQILIVPAACSAYHKMSVVLLVLSKHAGPGDEYIHLESDLPSPRHTFPERRTPTISNKHPMSFSVISF